MASGIALALHFATWIASLSYTRSPRRCCSNTAPIFAVILSRLFLHERVSGAVLAAIALAFVGAGLIAWGDWAAPSPCGNLGRGGRGPWPRTTWWDAACATPPALYAYGVRLGHRRHDHGRDREGFRHAVRSLIPPEPSWSS
jgi:drug/metabolite transporter (DMT)-like permease